MGNALRYADLYPIYSHDLLVSSTVGVAQEPSKPQRSPHAYVIHPDRSVEHLKISSSLDNRIAQRAHAREQVFRDRNPPTMTLDEALAQDLAQGAVMQPSSAPTAEEESEHSDDDDDAKLKEKRAWDDWKDDNERGIGNRGYL